MTLHCLISAAASAQDGSLQNDSIHRLGENRNRTIVSMCSLAGRLNCSLIENSLIIEDQTWLQNISIGVITCNSSISPVLVFSNTTAVERNNLQCPTTVPLGQFNIVFDLNVYFDETANLTVINITVS